MWKVTYPQSAILQAGVNVRGTERGSACSLASAFSGCRTSSFFEKPFPQLSLGVLKAVEYLIDFHPPKSQLSHRVQHFLLCCCLLFPQCLRSPV